MLQLVSHLKFWFTNLHRVSDHLHRELSGKPLYQYSAITPELFLGGQYNHIGMPTLLQWGVTGVVNMRERVPLRLLKLKDVELLHLPTPDRHAPSQKQLLEGIEFIHRQLQNGGKVYIHCRWGEGRGPTMALAYLLSQKFTLSDAEKLIKKTRPFIYPTKQQRERLAQLEQYFQNPT